MVGRHGAPAGLGCVAGGFVPAETMGMVILSREQVLRGAAVPEVYLVSSEWRIGGNANPSSCPCGRHPQLLVVSVRYMAERYVSGRGLALPNSCVLPLGNVLIAETGVPGKAAATTNHIDKLVIFQTAKRYIFGASAIRSAVLLLPEALSRTICSITLLIGWRCTGRLQDLAAPARRVLSAEALFQARLDFAILFLSHLVLSPGLVSRLASSLSLMGHVDPYIKKPATTQHSREASMRKSIPSFFPTLVLATAGCTFSP
ncbi:hypothetical protein N656DRAFT_68279 [Canariomyces notabilis]|uniref:Uncharacterized protein n=1 Tax=Canariomyces notabilis TaxID=2074819 RepID=A0AAN6TNT1_9PEZI|nr:hypothetical protein N656DRAFT_68279 [Canariomyces arenarius]